MDPNLLYREHNDRNLITVATILSKGSHGIPFTFYGGFITEFKWIFAPDRDAM